MLRLTLFLLGIAALVIGFGKRLAGYFVFALRHDVHSYTLLIPWVSSYLVWRKRGTIFSHPEWRVLPQLVSALAALVLVGVQSRRQGLAWDRNALFSLDLFVLALAACILFVWCFGSRALSRAAFPLFFLIFAAPLPEAAVQRIEVALQYMSAEAFDLLLRLTPIPFVREGVTFGFPGLTLAVAPECSGIRSTIVLFLTALVAGHLFLKSRLRRVLLCLAVVPIGAFRNALRILTIAWLTLYVNPNTIRGPIHREGGPLFFAVSLVVIIGMLLVFVRGERLEGKR